MRANYNVESLEIQQSFITITASGLSMRQYSLDDLNYIKSKSFFISTNYPLSLKEPEFCPHLHVWSDYKTANFMEEHYKTKPKDCLWMTRPDAFTPEMEGSHKIFKKVDFWFDRIFYDLKSSCTFAWVLQLIQRITGAKNKTILVFGLDGFIPDDSPTTESDICGRKEKIPYSKWYDYYTNKDMIERTHRANKESLDTFVDEIEKMYREDPKYFENVLNCNPESRVKYLKKVNYREILG